MHALLSVMLLVQMAKIEAMDGLITELRKQLEIKRDMGMQGRKIALLSDTLIAS